MMCPTKKFYIFKFKKFSLRAIRESPLQTLANPYYDSNKVLGYPTEILILCWVGFLFIHCFLYCNSHFSLWVVTCADKFHHFNRHVPHQARESLIRCDLITFQASKQCTSFAKSLTYLVLYHCLFL